jgi:hypothetical protein
MILSCSSSECPFDTKTRAQGRYAITGRLRSLRRGLCLDQKGQYSVKNRLRMLGKCDTIYTVSLVKAKGLLQLDNVHTIRSHRLNSGRSRFRGDAK